MKSYKQYITEASDIKNYPITISFQAKNKYVTDMEGNYGVENIGKKAGLKDVIWNSEQGTGFVNVKFKEASYKAVMKWLKKYVSDFNSDPSYLLYMQCTPPKGVPVMRFLDSGANRFPKTNWDVNTGGDYVVIDNFGDVESMFKAEKWITKQGCKKIIVREN